jgi:hypothetical protein
MQQQADLVQVVDHSAEQDQEAIPMSQTSIQEEYCSEHRQELYVAYDTANDKLVCNQCIYASDIQSVESAMSTLSFTSFIAGNLKDLFDQKFQHYRASLESMQTIAPQQISQQLEGTVDNFFKQIEASIKAVESQVTERIHASKNLAELEEILSKSENSFGYSDEKLYDKARVEIEDYVK